MTAFFGIDERDAQGFLDNNVVCYPPSPGGRPDLHNIVSSIRNSDLVFIKRCAPESSLHIKAVGVVRSEYPMEGRQDVCLPVEWVWRGEKILDEVEEVLSLCGSPIYEEHNIMVQREIIDLLPEKYQLQQGLHDPL